ncbi:MAG: hypothetical protein HOE90_23290 [Bacteriovoracaceae bacterium]|jgi:hypothetical protein|nr:hypothetical protein [Bacteriovoracaceae bacterium]
MEKLSFITKYFVLLNLILLSTSALGAEQKSEAQFTAPKDLDLEFLILSQQLKDRKEHKPIGLYTKFDTSLLYSVTESDQVRLFQSSIYEYYGDKDDGENKLYPELAEAMYRRKKILNQKDQFIDLDLELKTYYVMDDDLRERWGYNGSFIPQLVAQKNILPWLHVKSKIRYHLNYITSGEPTTTRSEIRYYLSPTIIFSRQFMFNTELTYKHKIKNRKTAYTNKFYDYLELRPSMLYLVSRNLMTEIYGETMLMRSHDGVTISETAGEEFVIGAALYLSVF